MPPNPSTGAHLEAHALEMPVDIGLWAHACKMLLHAFALISFEQRNRLHMCGMRKHVHHACCAQREALRMHEQARVARERAGAA
jgi:hypothetical protein